jgi:hypothetical protein
VTEQRFIFAEVADQYEEVRPGYPDEVYDKVIAFGALRAGDQVVEIGAGTGKATMPLRARGFVVHALEPTQGMADVLRRKGVEIEQVTFEEWVPRQKYRAALAAQAWHWVNAADRYDRAAAALESGGTFAVWWNMPRPWEGDLGRENDAAYERYVPPNMAEHPARSWKLDNTLDELRAHGAFGPPEKFTTSWSTKYTRDEWIRLQQTASDHRMLEPAVRAQLHEAVGDVIDKYGGVVDHTFDVYLYMAKRL